VPLELAAAQVQLLAPLAELQGVEAQRGAVTAARGLILEPERELGRRPLAGEQEERRAVERIGRFRGREPRRVGERLQVREDDVGVLHHRRRVAVLRPREEPVGLVEHRRVARNREAQLLQVGLGVAADRPLRAVQGDPHLERRLLQVGARHTVDLAHLVTEGRVGRALLRLDDQLDRVARLGHTADIHGPAIGFGEGADAGPVHRPVAHGEVVVLVQLGGEHDPEPRLVQVIVGALDEELPARGPELLRAVGPAGAGGNPADVRVDPALAAGRAVAVHPHLGRAVVAGEVHRSQVEDVHCRIAGEARGVGYPEEAAGLEVEVPDLPVLRLGRGLPDRIGPLGDLAPLLRGGQGLELDRAHLEGGVDAEVAGGDRGRDEARGGRLEHHRAHVHPPDDLVLQSLVVDLDVVVGREVPLGIQVHVDVDPAPEETTALEVELIVQARRLEPAPATGVGIERERGRTALFPDPGGPDLEPGLTVDREVGVFRREAEDAVASPGGFGAVEGLGRIRDGHDRLAVERPEPESPCPLGARDRQRIGERAVEHRGARRRRQAGGTQPGGTERGRLLECEGGLLEAEPETQVGRVRLRAEYPRQP